MLVQHFFVLGLFVIEGVQAGCSVTRLFLQDPVIAFSEVLDTPFAPSGDPVVLNGVKDEAATLLAGRKATFFTELLPLGFEFFLGAGFLTG